jgi:hypothetical protein
VDVNYGRESSIAVDSSGKAHIVFGREGKLIPFTMGKLYYATAPAGGGTVSDGTIISESVNGTVTNDISIAEDGAIHITFQGYHDPSSKLRYLRSDNGGSSWYPTDNYGELVDSTEVSGTSSKNVFDSAGNLHAAYLINPEEKTYPDLKLAVRDTDGSWTFEEPDPAITCYGDISHMITSDDTTYIVYNEDTGEGGEEWVTHTRLMIAERVPGESWTTSTIMAAEVSEE